MKTEIKLYSQDGFLGTKPRVNIEYSDLITKAKSNELKNYFKKQKAYSDFCKGQTSTGQKRKNERFKKRKELFSSTDVNVITEAYELKEKLEKEIVSKMSFDFLVIDYDGRRKNNFFKIQQGVILALNVGGISPQYYDLGLKHYFVVKNK